MNKTSSISIFRMELERRLASADVEMVVQNGKALHENSGIGNGIANGIPNGKKHNVPKLKIRDLMSTFRLFQPCCFPAVSSSKLSAPASRRCSFAAKSRSASITASTYKVKTSSGRLSSLKMVDKEVVQVFLPVRDEILARLIISTGLDNWGDGALWDISLTVISYKTQVVVGMNYFVKIQVNDGPVFLHCRIYQPVEGEPFLTDMIFNKKANDDIEYF